MGTRTGPMLRVALFAALVAVAVSAPQLVEPWTSQLAEESQLESVAAYDVQYSAYGWTTGLESGTYCPNPADNSTCTDLGATEFNTLFWASRHHIVKRLCANCSADYQEIYYRRLSQVDSFAVYDYLKDNWNSSNNALGLDFNIYSTYDDAKNEANPWTYCNYDDAGVGFPRDCGKTQSDSVAYQWNSWQRDGGQDVRFQIEGIPYTFAPTNVNVKGTYVSDCHCTACHFEIRESGHTYKPDISSCAHECAWDSDCQTVLHDSIKHKCFWYHNTNSRDTPMPVLKNSSTYNSIPYNQSSGDGGNEFTCWYKTEEYDHPTLAPTTLAPTPPTLAPSQYPTQTQSPTTAASFETFDSSTKGSSIVLSNNDRTATSSNNDHSWNSVYGTGTYTSGTKAWYVNVTKLHDHTANYWEMVIGVAHTTTRGANVFINSQEGVGYIQENGDKTQSGSSPDHTSYGSSYTVGDVIGVHLDIDGQTLSFSKNGITQGTAYTSTDIVSGKTWRLAVMVGDEDDEVEIVG